MGSEVAIATALNTPFTDVQIDSWDDWYAHIEAGHDKYCYPPGERWMYFNDGFTILQYMIEKVSKQTYAEFIQHRILAVIDRLTKAQDNLKGEFNSIKRG